ncbi:MAG: cell surface protein [Myxococcota bacterium]
MRALLCGLVLLEVACGAPPPAVDAGVEPEPVVDAGPPRPDDPWADRVVRFVPGPGAGFGQDLFPGVVLGPPSGGGDSAGSLDVLSLGNQGVIELEFLDLVAVDGPGVDLLVFENGFTGFFETGAVAVSDDGVDWRTFPCGADAGVSRCAGTRPVYANPAQGISGTEPLVAGGDGFDLSDVGLARARFVRVTDSGANRFYGPPGGGFDLDAVSVVNTAPRSP